MTMRERAAPLAGRYELRRMLGQGGMARVYAAQDLMLNRVVAVKQLQPGLVSDKQARERFLREGRLVAGLSHRGIACIYDVVDDEAGPFLVQELVRGRDLDTVLPLPHADALRVVADLADTLAFIHQNNIVHCDVKPQNVILADDGRPVLIDFGIAEPEGAKVKQLLGTPQYVSPERVQGAPPSPAGDVYALGVMFYELLTGRVPLDGSTPQEIIRRHIHEGVPPLRHAAPGMATAVEELLARATDRDPARRPTMAELAVEIREILEAATRVTSVIPIVRQRHTVPINNMLTDAMPSVYEPPKPPPPAPTLRERVTHTISRIMPGRDVHPATYPGSAAAARVEPRHYDAVERAGPAREPQGGWWRDRRLLLPLLLLPLLVGLGLVLRSRDQQVDTPVPAEQVRSRSGAEAPVAKEATPLSWPETLADNLDAPSWAQGTGRGWSLIHVEGRYRMKMQAGLGLLYSLSTIGELPGGDVAISFDVDPREGSAGMLFGFQDEANHYRLLSGVDGTYRLERRVGGNVESLASGDGAGAGRMTLVLQGQKALVYMGDRQLVEAQLPESVRGKFGFVLVSEGGAIGHFDNLSIRKAP